MVALNDISSTLRFNLIVCYTIIAAVHFSFYLTALENIVQFFEFLQLYLKI